MRFRRGAVVVQVRVTAQIVVGSVFLPIHEGRGDGHYKAVNNSTHDAMDPSSKEPDLKYCAVRVRLLSEPGVK